MARFKFGDLNSKRHRHAHNNLYWRVLIKFWRPLLNSPNRQIKNLAKGSRYIYIVCMEVKSIKTLLNYYSGTIWYIYAELNSNKSTVTVNDCTEEISISVGGTIGVLVVLLVVVVLIYFCYWYTNKCSCKLESGQ